MYEIDLSGEAPHAFKHVGSLEIRGRDITIDDVYGERVYVQHGTNLETREVRWNTMWDLKTQMVASWYPTSNKPRAFVDQVSEE